MTGKLSWPSRFLATALSGVLVALAPGLGPYAVIAGEFNERADVPGRPPEPLRFARQNALPKPGALTPAPFRDAAAARTEAEALLSQARGMPGTKIGLEALRERLTRARVHASLLTPDQQTRLAAAAARVDGELTARALVDDSAAAVSAEVPLGAAGPAPAARLKRWAPKVAAAAVATLSLGAGLSHAAHFAPAAGLGALVAASIVLHEVAHLAVLRFLGDDTHARHGHGTLNPLRQIDPWGTIAVPLASLAASSIFLGVPVLFGWAKPVPVDFNKLRDPKREPAWVAAAGPAANLVLAGLAFALSGAHPGFLLAAKVNLGLAAFNLLSPLPTSDGGKLLVRFMPASAYRWWIGNPNLPGDMQSVYRRLYQGPSRILSWLPFSDQNRVNLLARGINLAAVGGLFLLGHAFFGLPFAFLMLACAYDFYCIREKMQNEDAVKALLPLYRRGAAALARLAEGSAAVKSEANTEEIKHILNNSLEEVVDGVVDSEGFDRLSAEEKWGRFLPAYLENLARRLKEHPKGLPDDELETIRGLLEHESFREEYLAPLKAWIEAHEVWAKWRSPGRTGEDEASHQEKSSRSKDLGTQLGLLAAAALGAKLLGAHGVHAAAGAVALLAATVLPAEPPAPSFEKLAGEAPGLEESERGLLLRYLSDMSAERKPPVIGRVKEAADVVAAVTGPRGSQNAVLLLADTGVGKTAVAEKVAQSILELEAMRGRFLLRLDLPAILQDKNAPAILDALARAVAKLNEEDPRRGNKAVLFVDDLHQLLLDPRGPLMTNALLEPLREGRLAVVAATTPDFYRTRIETDPGFAGRFAKVWLKEASAAESLRYLQGTRAYYEGLHGARIEDQADKDAVELSSRDQDRRLPQRAFYYRDRALRKASFAARRDRLTLALLDKAGDAAYAADRLAAALACSASVTDKLKENEPDALDLYNAVARAAEELVELWRRRAAVPASGTPVVTADLVREEIAEETGVATGQLAIGREKLEKYLRMEEVLNKIVIGQEEAIHAVAESVRAEKAGLSEPNEPTGIFFLTGPTGSGKTYFAKKLAEYLFGSEDDMIRLDMSEYMQSHEVAKLIGSPPGYIGYDAGGQLTEKVRRRPDSVVLLDEIEKAHPNAWLLLLQIFSDGRLTDGKGRLVSFKDTIILMSSNLGMRLVDLDAYVAEFKALKAKLAAADQAGDGDARLAVEKEIEAFSRRMAAETKAAAQAATDDAFQRTFPAEFEGRVHQRVVFNRITPENAAKIVELELGKLKKVVARGGNELSWDEPLVKLLVEKGFDVRLGARPLNNALRLLVRQPMARELLETAAANGDKLAPSRIRVRLENGAISFDVSPLPRAAVERKDPAGQVAAAVFEKLLGAALEAAARKAPLSADARAIESWAAEAAGNVDTRSGSEYPQEYPAFLVFDVPLRLGPQAPGFLSENASPTAKDAGVQRAREALHAATSDGVTEKTRDVVLRTVDDEEHPYVGWLKLFVQQAKEEGRAPVEIAFETGEALRVLIHRPGELGAREREFLRTHFSGPVPASVEESQRRAELLNVRGKKGRQQFFDLYRELSRLGGARLGHAEGAAARGGSGVDYWLEIPTPSPPAPLPAPAPSPPDQASNASPAGSLQLHPPLFPNAAAQAEARVRQALSAAGYGAEPLHAARLFLMRVIPYVRERIAELGGTLTIRWQVTAAEARIELEQNSSQLFWGDGLASRLPARDELSYPGARLVVSATRLALVMTRALEEPSRPPERKELSKILPGDGPRGFLRELSAATLDQGEARGPMVRVAAAELLGEVSEPQDLPLAREWLGLEDHRANASRLAAGAAVLQRQGNWAEDGPALARALAYVSSNSNHELKPVRTALENAVQALLEKDPAMDGPALLALYRTERDKLPGGPTPMFGAREARNDGLVDAVYRALCRRGGPEALDDLVGPPDRPAWSVYTTRELAGYLKRTAPARLRGYYDEWAKERKRPEGVDAWLTLRAIAEHGTDDDAPHFLGILRTYWSGWLTQNIGTTAAAEAFADFVARTGIFPELRGELRRWLSGNLYDDESFAELIAAAKAAGAAGGALELPWLERVLEVDPNDAGRVTNTHEMSQHEAADAWARAAVRSGSIEGFLTERDGRGLTLIERWLSDANPLKNIAALHALRLQASGEIPHQPQAAAPAGPFFHPGAPKPELRRLPEERATHFHAMEALNSLEGPLSSRLDPGARSSLRAWAALNQELLRGLARQKFSAHLFTVDHQDGSAGAALLLTPQGSKHLAAGLKKYAELVSLLLHLRHQEPAERQGKLEALGRELPNATELYALLNAVASLPGARLTITADSSSGPAEVWLSFEVPERGS